MTDPDILKTIGQLNDRIQELKSIGTPGGFTVGSALFAGTNGKITQDNTNFIWDNTNKRLGIGVTPTAALHVAGAVLTGTSLNVGAVGNDLAYLQGTTATTKLQLFSSGGGSGDARIYVWAGQPGVSFVAGGVSFNWRQAGGGVMGRADTGTGGAYLRLLSNQSDMNAVTTGGVVVPVQVWSSIGGAAATGFLGAAAAIRQTSGANLTNNVTVGGTDDTITNWTNLTTYSTDAAAIRNAVYQLARKLKQLNDGLRTLGLFT